jgi:signal transduction histidine kinase/AmiR/NasT family two-component response regulator
MIVEDERIIAEDIKKSLINFGYKVPMIFSTGEEAIRKVHEINPDLILMDIILQGDLNGVETAAEIRKVLSIPIIFLTAYSDESTLERAKRAEPHGFITKPYDENTLHTTIETALYKHNMEKKLREKEEGIRKERDNLINILDSMEDGIYIVDRDFEITYMNPAFRKRLGNYGGLKCFQFFHERNDICPWCSVSKIYEGKTVRREVAFPHLNKIYDVIDAPVKNLDGQLEKLSIYRDITERKLFEKEQERLNNELLSTNKELESMIYVASHDLRSPLVNIQGFSEELANSVTELAKIVNETDLPAAVREKMNQLIVEDIQDSVKYVINSTIRLDMMLTGLLKISRLGQGKIEFKEIDMNLVIKEIMMVLEYSVKEKAATVKQENLPKCYGDPLQINQLFLNLIDNALKYLDPARQGVVRINGKESGEYIEYTVEDNGIGIPHKYQEKVFDIFNRLSPEMAKGEGIGLAIVKKVLERHKGSIRIESKENQGSKFLVKLPGKEIISKGSFD